MLSTNRIGFASFEMVLLIKKERTFEHNETQAFLDQYHCQTQQKLAEYRYRICKIDKWVPHVYKFI